MEQLFILIAEDDADDRYLLQSAFEENGFSDKLQFVENGMEVVSYLSALASGDGTSGFPHFILLDWTMH
jgi:CheY-like chemotaxis protein